MHTCAHMIKKMDEYTVLPLAKKVVHQIYMHVDKFYKID